MQRYLKRFLWPIIWVASLAVIFSPGFGRIHKLKAKNNDLLKKNIKLEAENELLKREISRIEKDQVYQEKILREKMGVVRKDEVPVKIITDQRN